MADHRARVTEEINVTLERAGFQTLSSDVFHVDVTDSFQRKLGECQAIQGRVGEQYRIRIAQRLFEDDLDIDWRDTVRHEVAHAYVISQYEGDVRPHGPEWKEAARQAGADPTARYEGDDLVDANYVLACPAGCFERGYLKRSKRIKFPWKYGCQECETRLVSYDAGKAPSARDPGTCYVASIPWQHEDDRKDVNTSESAAYLLACPNGCTEWSYQQRAKRIKNPWRYSCPDCDTKLISCDGQDTPTAFDPGTCNVESLPWTRPQLIYACPNGCFSVGYAQHFDETRHPSRYRCGECNTQTVSYPADNPPDNPTSGTKYTN